MLVSKMPLSLYLEFEDDSLCILYNTEEDFKLEEILFLFNSFLDDFILINGKYIVDCIYKNLEVFIF